MSIGRFWGAVVLGFVCCGSVRAQLGDIAPLIKSHTQMSLFDPAKGGRVILIDLIATFGEQARNLDGTVNRTMGVPRVAGENLSDRIWLRILDKHRDPHSAGMFQAGRNLREVGMKVQNGELQWSAQQRWGFINYGATYKDRAVDVYNFPRNRFFSSRVQGGFTHRRFGIYVEDGTETILPADQAPNLADILTFLVTEFEDNKSDRFARMLLDLSRFYPLTNVATAKETKKILRSARRKIKGLRRLRQLTEESGSVASFYLFEQAALRANLPTLFKKLEPGRTTISYMDSYPVYRLLAESKDIPASNRALAFERCMTTPKGVGFHEQWIKMLKNNEISMTPGARDQLIAKFREEISSRSPQSLFVLSAGLLAVFVFSILLMRVSTRRLMFLG